MKTGRWLGAMLLLLGTGLGVIHLRTEQSRCAARILSSETERLRLRSELWAYQTGVARLRSPGAVRDRLARLEAPSRSGVGLEASETNPGMTLTSR
ncbi:MAG: hypothetical protein FLDDKLPJ_03185 [Phycisphaerae bacterium]|nr:hypothetical protein [Phycisphaerae bacterium]